jgi:hypothetical protein
MLVGLPHCIWLSIVVKCQKSKDAEVFKQVRDELERFTSALQDILFLRRTVGGGIDLRKNGFSIRNFVAIRSQRGGRDAALSL